MPWRFWIALGGRGVGKTRLAAEDIAWYATQHPGHRIAIIGADASSVRDVCVEGESGLLSVLPPLWKEAVYQRRYGARWNRSLGELVLPNAVICKLYSAEEPDKLRGPQHHRAWGDEFASWRFPDKTLEMLDLGLRLGDDPRCILTTTPKPVKALKTLLADPHTVMVRESTYENLANLAPTTRAAMLARYEGTRLGRQELYAEIIEDVEGALWSRELLDRHRVERPCPSRRVVVAIDPAVTSHSDSDETGIVVAALGEDGHGYLLNDSSGRYSPDGWARMAIRLAGLFSADRIIAEVNNGGDMVAHTIRSVDPMASVKTMRASMGKYARAEPVSALYEQGKVHHVGMYGTLEDQLCSWHPLGKDGSPDRLDALVWAFTELLLKKSTVATIQAR